MVDRIPPPMTDSAPPNSSVALATRTAARSRFTRSTRLRDGNTVGPEESEPDGARPLARDRATVEAFVVGLCLDKDADVRRARDDGEAGLGDGAQRVGQVDLASHLARRLIQRLQPGGVFCELALDLHDLGKRSRGDDLSAVVLALDAQRQDDGGWRRPRGPAGRPS